MAVHPHAILPSIRLSLSLIGLNIWFFFFVCLLFPLSSELWHILFLQKYTDFSFLFIFVVLVSLKVILLLLIPSIVWATYPCFFFIVFQKKRKNIFLCLFVCALKVACLQTVQQCLCRWFLSLLFPPTLPAFLSFYLLPLKQITYRHRKSQVRLKSMLPSFTNNHSKCTKVSLPHQGSEEDIKEPVVVKHGSLCFYFHALVCLLCAQWRTAAYCVPLVCLCGLDSSASPTFFLYRALTYLLLSVASNI